jgi:hypothetical protein
VTPVLVQVSPPVHVVHAAPKLPQYMFDSAVSHVVPEQQPVQDVLLQTHEPPEHSCPVTHSAPVPHVQTPSVHSLAKPPQLTHAAPPVPQCAVVPGETHVLPLQQPVPQEVALHSQVPEMHCWPLAQTAPAPHAHVPSAVHVSAVIPQLVQVPPFSPQCDGVAGSTHVLPEQHPTGQLVGLQLAGHTPALQVPEVQATHAPPPVPQLVVVLPASQVLPLQQPVGHEVALHTQAPEMHS